MQNFSLVLKGHLWEEVKEYENSRYGMIVHETANQQVTVEFTTLKVTSYKRMFIIHKQWGITKVTFRIMWLHNRGDWKDMLTVFGWCEKSYSFNNYCHDQTGPLMHSIQIKLELDGFF